MTANMKLLGWERGASSLCGVLGHSATGQNAKAAKGKNVVRAGCRENTAGFRLREKCFSLDIPLYRTSELPLGGDGQECHQISRCLPKIVRRKSCARSAKSYSYRSATMGSTRMARRAGT